ncbi:BAX protein [Salmonella enterica subsp. enterica serovar Daytona]|uniref:BAX protein n=1 Tax=Salmonella enterica subsp. enterica serovar Daytona TaxID=1962639 RepID=A0A447JAD6_SALET|nr:BAX protein [Salmonella enterica subsp. enterica serovar Daytona]
MPYITSQNAAITADRNWLISKQYQNRWSPSERARMKDIAKRYKSELVRQHASYSVEYVAGARRHYPNQHGGDDGGGGKRLGNL